MQLPVDPIARQFGGRIRARQEKRMAGCLAKMFHEGGSAELMRGLRGTAADFQNLTEGAERVSSCLGSVIRARVGDDDDP